jgi:hypothetical protein
LVIASWPQLDGTPLHVDLEAVKHFTGMQVRSN